MSEINNQNNPQDVIDIRELILTCLRNWYWFALSIVFCVGVAALYIFSTTPKFSVSSSIMVRLSDDGGGAAAMAGLPAELTGMMGVGGVERVGDQLEILNSRTVMRGVIEELNIQTSYRKQKGLRWFEQYPARDLTIVYPPLFTDTMRLGVVIELEKRKNDYKLKVQYGEDYSSKHKVTSLTEPIETCLGTIYFQEHAALEKGDAFRIFTTPMSVLVDAYREELSGKQVKKESTVVSISTVTDCPAKAQDMIEKMIYLYNNDAIFDKNNMAINTRAFVEERLQVVGVELDSIEHEVETYRKANKITSISSEANIILESTSDYEKRIASIETQIGLMGFIKDFVGDEANAQSLIPANLGVSDPTLISLIDSYNNLVLKRMRIQRTATDANPMLEQIDAQLVTMRSNIVTSINSISAGLELTKEQNLARLAELEGRIKDVPQQEREYIKIRRQQEIKQNIYTFLYQKLEENAIALASTVLPAKVIDKAQADSSPVAPRRMIILFFALCFGGALPIAGLFLYGLWNNTIADSKEYERLVKAPFLGKLVQSRQKTNVVVTASENSASAELFRLLRTNIRFMLPADKKSHVILITSSVSGEGKTFVAVNLSVSLALLNKRVCVIGLDLRKPMLANYLNMSNKGCLTAYLADSEYTLDDIILPSGVHGGLDVIPAGVIPPNPNELLQGERLKALIAELRERYDYVIIDSAPVGMVSDTFLLTELADATLYISRANYTTREMADLINGIYEQKRLPNMACVLNGVKQAKSGYGYGYGYGYGHANG